MSLYDRNGNIIHLDSESNWELFRWNLTNPKECTYTRQGDYYRWKTGFILVEVGKTYYCLHCTVTGYDENKNSKGTITLNGGTITIPEGVCFVVLDSGLTSSETIPDSLKLLQRGYGRYSLTYNDRANISYDDVIPILSDDTLEYFKAYLGDVKPFAGKKIVFIGDSFTAPDTWCQSMCNKLSAIHHGNYAVSGGAFADYDGVPKTAYEQAQNLVTNEKSPDVILITLGTNDAENKKTINDISFSTDISSFDLSTYTGGMQACLNYLQNNFPNAIIYIGFTPMGGLSNSNIEYIERMKEVALLYGIEYIETRTCGVTTLSTVYADCYESGVKGGHPTANGQNKIAEYMTRLMSSKK